MTHVDHGWRHAPKAKGGTDPIPGLGGGIQFDTYPQEGNWLYVKTLDASGSPNGYGMQLVDFSDGGMEFDTADAFWALGQTAGLGYGAYLDSSTGIGLHNHSVGEIAITNTSEDGIRIEDQYSSSGTGIKIKSDHGPVFIDAKDGMIILAEQTTLTIGSNGTSTGTGMFADFSNLQYLLYTLGGSPVLQINWNGVNWEYHGVTGSTWAFDL